MGPGPPRVRWGSKYALESSQWRHRNHPAFPTQWFERLLRAPRGTGLSCPHHPQASLREPSELDTSVGVSGPHGLTVREDIVRPRIKRCDISRPPLPASTFMTIAIRPSW